MVNQQKVSIIIPCFNMGQYIYEAVKSFLDQTFRNFEILIIDDGSTDGKPVNYSIHTGACEP
ncbi:MAG: putative teichuronic acid biosynthesis glycosyltransferase TuaG [Deltaproteobacteria bacterium ADurb.Bin022]|jgi:glycosyltransferase involved in cell wall biosynthesis|nr:MAG: putative teichuronic acid biosynthesis glycosyltransferase TuaG [Deltaproteobacteria bacterium ADurb.Bin022]HOG82076.1 glycosyltransferase [Smithellaceae bacterium]